MSKRDFRAFLLMFYDISVHITPKRRLVGNPDEGKGKREKAKGERRKPNAQCLNPHYS
jgi:hypothetical protein